MTVKDYEKQLIGELCWCCGAATHRSNERQRQCPKCRRKFSYHQQQKQWALLQAFVLQASAHHAAKTVGTAYHTAYRFYMSLREYLAQAAAKEGKCLLGEIELDESYFGGRRKGRRGRGAAGKVKVFGLLERQGQVVAVVVPDCTKETLMDKIKAHALKGAVFYTDEFQSYRDLSSYGKHLPIDHQKTYVEGRRHINGIEGFWSYAKQMFLRTHGVDPENFPLYLAEYQFRYNHRRDDLLTVIFSEFLWPKIASKINKNLP